MSILRTGASLFNKNFFLQKKFARCLTLSKAEKQNDYISVKWDHINEYRKYPIELLADLCKCEDCFQATSNQRLRIFADLPFENSKIEKLSFDNQTEKIHVKFVDKFHVAHNFVVPYNQLFQATEKSTTLGHDLLLANRVLWHTAADMELTKLDFENVITHKKVANQLIDSLISYGVVLIKNAPAKTDAIFELAKMINFFKKTNYGETFMVKTKFNPSNLAYTSSFIPPHVDLPYWKYIPSVQLLHCIERCKTGGESTFVDGVAAAVDFMKSNKVDFEVLCNTPVLYENIGEDSYGKYHLQHTTPIINFDKNTNTVLSIKEGNFQRTCFLGSFEQVQAAYRSYKKFYTLLNEKSRNIVFTMEAGDIVVFDNLRALHGRLAFSLADDQDSRLLQGAYFDWDQLLSFRRINKN